MEPCPIYAKYCPRGNVNHVANVMTTTVIFRICPVLLEGERALQYLEYSSGAQRRS